MIFRNLAIREPPNKWSDFPPFFHVNHAIVRPCEVRAAAVSGLGVMGVAARGFQDEAAAWCCYIWCAMDPINIPPKNVSITSTMDPSWVIVDLAMNIVIFHSKLLVYQRVLRIFCHQMIPSSRKTLPGYT